MIFDEVVFFCVSRKRPTGAKVFAPCAAVRVWPCLHIGLTVGNLRLFPAVTNEPLRSGRPSLCGHDDAHGDEGCCCPKVVRVFSRVWSYFSLFILLFINGNYTSVLLFSYSMIQRKLLHFYLPCWCLGGKQPYHSKFNRYQQVSTSFISKSSEIISLCEVLTCCLFSKSDQWYTYLCRYLRIIALNSLNKCIDI